MGNSANATVTFDKGATPKQDGPKKVDGGKSITRAIGRGGLGNLDLFWAQMALASLAAISGPKKDSIFGSLPLPITLVMDCPRIKIFYDQEL
jgi:hypothetical protein